MRKFSFAVGCVAVLFLLWFALSWVDVITDNLEENPQHSKYNAFVLLAEFGEETNE